MTVNRPCKKEAVNEIMEEKEDYVFSFKLKTSEEPVDPDSALVDFFRSQLQDIFNVVFFSKNGEKIIPNEFGFLNNQDKKYTL